MSAGKKQRLEDMSIDSPRIDYADMPTTVSRTRLPRFLFRVFGDETGTGSPNLNTTNTIKPPAFAIGRGGRATRPLLPQSQMRATP
jgi:hypothetical protein